MVECLPDPWFKEDYSHHLAYICATCLDLDEYSINEETDTLERSDEDNLFKVLWDNCDKSIKENKDAVIHLKNKVLDNVKVHVKKGRTRRYNSVGSVSCITSTCSNKRKALTIITVSYVNIHGRSGLNHAKQMQIETFLYHNDVDLLHLQEVDIVKDSFRNCNFISSSFNILTNNSPTKYSTASLLNLILMRNILSVILK